MPKRDAKVNEYLTLRKIWANNRLNLALDSLRSAALSFLDNKLCSCYKHNQKFIYFIKRHYNGWTSTNYRLPIYTPCE